MGACWRRSASAALQNSCRYATSSVATKPMSSPSVGEGVAKASGAMSALFTCSHRHPAGGTLRARPAFAWPDRSARNGF
eukprot:42600-Prymnesium_polylepis.4